MSARDQLLAYLHQAGLSAPRAEANLNAFAHELAEEQRAYAREVGVPLEDGNIVSAGDVIDLIDPQQGSDAPAPDPAGDGTCTAMINDRRRGLVHCAQPAGHYNEADAPDFQAGDEPRGWHRSETDADGNWTTWADWADGATPKSVGPVRPDEEPTT